MKKLRKRKNYFSNHLNDDGFNKTFTQKREDFKKKFVR